MEKEIKELHKANLELAKTATRVFSDVIEGRKKFLQEAAGLIDFQKDIKHAIQKGDEPNRFSHMIRNSRVR